MKRYLAIPVVLAAAAVGLPGCGGSQSTTRTVTVAGAEPTPPATTQAAGSSSAAAAASAANDAVVNQASQAPDNQAQLGADAIRAILTKKVGLNDQESFNLSGHIDPGDNGGDCYVKLGADAVNFEDQTGNILRAPNGTEVVFVQSNTVTTLVRCLKAVRTALAW
jgi:hypothetical protein